MNLEAEMEIMQVHARRDELTVREWRELLAVQQRQVEALARIERRSRAAGAS